MRGTRWVLLLAIAAILGGVAATYRAQRLAMAQHALPKPAALSLGLNSSAENWHWEQTEDKQPFRKTAEITAKNARQVKDTQQVQLEQVEFKVYQKDDQTYDLIKSAAATFSASDGKLVSEGEVEITLKVPKEGPPKRDLVTIKSRGVTFDRATGFAETAQETTFQFPNGTGKSKGATYDPTTHQIEMKSEVEMDRKGAGPGAKPVHLLAPNLLYLETKQEIWLRPWGKLTRGETVIEGEDAVVTLERGVMRKVSARNAHGLTTYPKRTLEYQANGLWVDLDENGEVSKVVGEPMAKLISDTAVSVTTVNSHRVEMEFASENGDNVLRKVTSIGNSEVEQKPKPAAGQALGETHVLRSEIIDMAMRPGGSEIETVTTRAAGRLEFLPNLPTQRRRTLDGKQLVIAYGPENRIESFRATEARTRTEPTAEEKKRNRAVAVTSSRDLLAKFEPKTNRMASLEQWGDFTYEEGDRRARAAKASMDAAQNVIHLETGARMWDLTGATSADRIRMDQRTGDFTAEGNVTSSRLPEQKKKSSEMLSGDEPLQARARKMDAANRNRRLHYEGGVHMWQGANRITADVVDVDREKHTLVAAGSVVSTLWEQPKEDQRKQGKPALPTVVRSSRLVYTETDRLAHYSGGAHMVRNGTDVTSQELRAWLAEEGDDSSLERAFADGKVTIVMNRGPVRRTGTGEHAEYYTGDQKVIMRGGNPQLVDSKGSRTQGEELTYFANDDKLLVNGTPDRPVNSYVRTAKP